MRVLDRRGREIGSKAKVRRVLPSGTTGGIDGTFLGLDGSHRNAGVEWHHPTGASVRFYPATRLFPFSPFSWTVAVNDLELIDSERTH